MAPLADIVPSGVVTGDDLVKLLEHARDNAYAIPAVNCTRCVRPSTTRLRPSTLLGDCLAVFKRLKQEVGSVKDGMKSFYRICCSMTFAVQPDKFSVEN